MAAAVRSLILARQSAGDSDFTGRWYLKGYANSLVIIRTNQSTGVNTNVNSVPGGTRLPFTISGTGGLVNNNIEVFQDEVTDVSKLPLESFTDHNIKILNSDSAEDDYYVKFVAYQGTGGNGYWKETVARDASPGVDNTTMPHELQ
jgi:hypothetical protein